VARGRAEQRAQTALACRAGIGLALLPTRTQRKLCIPACLATESVEEAMGRVTHEGDVPGVACALGAKAVR